MAVFKLKTGPAIFTFAILKLGGMKIIHTADWHIGKKLHKHDLSEDFSLFIDWLCELVINERADALLVAGDVFDLANPGSDARRAYYRALLKLSKLNCQLIITGGNHDSPAVLNAPSELLRNLNIHVIGSLPEAASDFLLPLKNQAGETELVVAAIPYLRDPDLRQANEEVSYENRIEAIRQGIARIFGEAAEFCQRQFPGVPALAMGHLYAAGASSSDSERDIQIGNEASFEVQRFGSYFSYIALGHIHKPQRLNGLVPTFYSGSPLPLSFSERSDAKRLLLIDTAKGFEPVSIAIPSFRKMLRLSGTLASLQAKLQELEADGPLKTLVELEMEEEKSDPDKIIALDRLVQDFEHPRIQIVKHRAYFKDKPSGAGALYGKTQALEDLHARDVFDKLLGSQELTPENHSLLKEAFEQVLEEVESSKY